MTTQLIPVVPATIGQQSVQTVDGRTLHTFLEVRTRFNDWIVSRIEEYGFEEGKDFRSFFSETSKGGFTENSVKPQGGRPSKEYTLSIGMGKELAMVERTEKGRQARRYFIECERIALEALGHGPAPAAPPPRKPIRSRDDLSFVQRDSQGRLKNWVVEHDPKGNWHIGVAIGKAYLAEIMELAAHDPEEARWAVKTALIEGAALNWPREGWGIECGFAEGLAEALFPKEKQPARPALRADRPRSLTAQRRFDAHDAWLPAVQAYLVGRQAVTLTEILLHLNVEPNQRAKNRLSKLLQGLGWRLHVTSVQGNGCRVYRND